MISKIFRYFHHSNLPYVSVIFQTRIICTKNSFIFNVIFPKIFIEFIKNILHWFDRACFDHSYELTPDKISRSIDRDILDWRHQCRDEKNVINFLTKLHSVLLIISISTNLAWYKKIALRFQTIFFYHFVLYLKGVSRKIIIDWLAIFSGIFIITSFLTCQWFSKQE